jgi:hypothetical protein
MEQLTATIVARRRRQSVTLGRAAAWLGFGAAVLGQAAFLAAIYLLIAGTSATALPDAAIAGTLAIFGGGLMVVARKAAKRAQSSAARFARTPLRLIAETRTDLKDSRHRPAA